MWTYICIFPPEALKIPGANLRYPYSDILIQIKSAHQENKIMSPKKRKKKVVTHRLECI